MQSIISETSQNLTILSSIDRFMKSNKIPELLKQSNFGKEKGFSAYLIFRFIFCLVFTGKNLYRTLVSNAKCDIGKDAVYRFMSSSKNNWRRFLLLLASQQIRTISALTSNDRKAVLIVDDSLYDRSRSKCVELLSRVFDHVGHKYVKGFRMLTLAWSDGNTLIPVSFSLLSSEKETNRLCPMDDSIDKRNNGYKLRKEAVRKAPDVMLSLLKEAKKHGVNASYLLFDSWFSFPSTIMQILEEKFHVIAMLKSMPKVFYRINDRAYNLEALFALSTKRTNISNILSSLIVELGRDKENNAILAKIVFVKAEGKKREWLAIISTDITLPDEEIVRIYGKRWDIEVFFKIDKSLLKLAKEFQCRSYDSMVAHTTIVFVRYMMLAVAERERKDDRTAGGIFFEYCDELKDIDFATSISILIKILKNILKNIKEISSELIDLAVSRFIQSISMYFNNSNLFLSCES